MDNLFYFIIFLVSNLLLSSIFIMKAHSILCFGQVLASFMRIKVASYMWIFPTGDTPPHTPSPQSFDDVTSNITFIANKFIAALGPNVRVFYSIGSKFSHFFGGIWFWSNKRIFARIRSRLGTCVRCCAWRRAVPFAVGFVQWLWMASEWHRRYVPPGWLLHCMLMTKDWLFFLIFFNFFEYYIIISLYLLFCIFFAFSS